MDLSNSCTGSPSFRNDSERNQEDRWLVHGERSVYESPWVRVGLADISQPSGERFEHHTVWFPPVAMAIVFDDSGDNILMAWRHRFAPNMWSWEVPGGIIDGDESPEETVIREIEEETGYRPRSIEPLITFEPAVGMLRNPNHLFVVRGVERVANPTEQNEGTFQWVPFREVPDLIRAGQVGNSGALIGLLHVLALGGK
ncbi:NUDIX hydrolase [Amycolatopsis thermoflava]|uniref:NUDIX hydrolase n=1 Tax=Amycolatopsis thermoflava TaxID=84480 RepID=UPI003EBC4B89